MPIYDLGYRGWQGRRVSPLLRWFVVGQTGFHLTWRGIWLKMLMFCAWIPAFFMGSMFFLYEQAVPDDPMVQSFAFDLLKEHPIFGPFFAGFEGTEGRAEVWAAILSFYLRYPQGFFLVLILGLTAPRLLAGDVRSRAFLLYFSRPITRWEYILGKSFSVWIHAALITAIPGLALYVTALMLTNDFSAAFYTWHLPILIVAASAAVAVPATLLGLALSAAAARSVPAAFMWYGIWVLGWVAYNILYWNDDPERRERWAPLSLYNAAGEVQRWIFGLDCNLATVAWGVALLAVISGASLAVIYWRVSAPMRI